MASLAQQAEMKEKAEQQTCETGYLTSCVGDRLACEKDTSAVVEAGGNGMLAHNLLTGHRAVGLVINRPCNAERTGLHLLICDG